MAPFQKVIKPQRPATTTTTQPPKAQVLESKTSASTGTKRKRTNSQKPTPGSVELPHGLGTYPSKRSRPSEGEGNGDDGVRDKRPRLRAEDTTSQTNNEPTAAAEAPQQEALATTLSKGQSTKRTRRPAAPYGHRWDETPFPDHKHPTPDECRLMNGLLTSAHGAEVAPETIPPPSKTFAGCGEVPSVLDALIRTCLSANVRGEGSGKAIAAVIEEFGLVEEGPAEGSVDYDNMRRQPLEVLVKVITVGGSQNKKGVYIKKILDLVYEENSARRAASADPGKAKELGFEADDPVQIAAEVSCADPKVLSLDHLRAMEYRDVFHFLIKYPGIALKTAACVCLYALHHPSMAVDTHVHRITMSAGWLPPGTYENKAFSHLEFMVPDGLKYSLHTLFVVHGKECVRCRSGSSESSPGWKKECVIEKLVQRVKTEKKKRLLKGQTTIKFGKLGKSKDGEEDGGANGSEHEDE